jgi:methyl-accepting chemotaxis protein/methyl-accepting chemotaxis protein-2 (aspartate sensor receptor)
MKTIHKISFKYAAAFIVVALSLLAVVIADALLVNMVTVLAISRASGLSFC